MARMIGGKDQRPWGLVLGLGEAADDLIQLFPFARQVESLYQFEQHEFDVVVTDEAVVKEIVYGDGYHHWELHGNLNVVSFRGGLPRVGLDSDESRNETIPDVTRASRSRTRTLDVLDPPTDHLFRLATELATDATRRIDFDPEFRHITVEPSNEAVRSKLIVLVQTPDGRPVVAHWLREGDGNAEVWALPYYADQLEWTRAILDYLASSRDGWVPPTPEPDSWRLQAGWMTKEESRIWIQIEDEKKRFDEERRRHEKALADLEMARVEAEKQTLDSYLGLVFNAGADLVQSVGSALVFLGFEVDYLDEARDPGDLREDLRVRIPEDGAWEAIAEVRNYKGGAKEEGYHRLVAKFLPGYVIETQRRPNGIWWFANTFRGRDLADREPIMASKPDLIEAFADIGGLAVDTADLLHLVLQVDRGQLTRDAARSRLINSTGVMAEFDRR